MPTAIKFYTDTHIAKAVAVQLRARGIDVVRCEEVGMAEADDDAHLAYATREGRVVITADRDFLRLHKQWQAAGKSHGGIIY
jgi:predicted nuclease of predicted toxin-antitoxin system